jgi:hypothetical protein
VLEVVYVAADSVIFDVLRVVSVEEALVLLVKVMVLLVVLRSRFH